MTAQIIRTLFAVVLVPISSLAQPCQLSWSDQFMSGAFSSTTTAAKVFDDGTGPSLYIGGSFRTASGLPASGIARWTGSQWESVGIGLAGHDGRPPRVLDLDIFDDGSGPALFAAGSFAQAGNVEAVNVARWDGSSWSDVDGGTNNVVNELLTADLGDGPALYAAGFFVFAGGSAIQHVAKWNGSSWAPLGAGLNHVVHDLAVYSYQDVPTLFACGYFTESDGNEMYGVARWDGQSWHSTGFADRQIHMRALAVLDASDGPLLFAAGSFNHNHGAAGKDVAQWDGTTWSAAGNGFDYQVLTLASFDSGNGPLLYAGGEFTNSGTTPIERFAVWTGTDWLSTGDGVDGPMNPGVLKLEPIQIEGRNELAVLGFFESAGGLASSKFATYHDAGWTRVGNGIQGRVSEACWHEVDGQSNLIVAGEVISAGEHWTNNIARWDGAVFHPLGDGFNAVVRAVESVDFGAGPELYAAGGFSQSGDLVVNGFAKWDGTSWSAPSPEYQLAWKISALCSFDDGSGPGLYAGGRLDSIGGSTPPIVMKWDGSEWQSTGLGLIDRDFVYALAVFDDGNGPRLYAAGGRENVGGMLFRFEGDHWEEVGFTSNSIYTLYSFEHDADNVLLIGGHFTYAGGYQANALAGWNGAEWLNFGLPFSTGSTVVALGSVQDYNNRRLYAAGPIELRGYWQERQLVSLEPDGTWRLEADDSVDSVAILIDSLQGDPPQMLAGGRFESLDGLISSGSLAQLNGCACLPDFNNDGIVNTLDFIAFLNAYNTSDPAADFNNDGIINTLDFIAFLNAYNLGCN